MILIIEKRRKGGLMEHKYIDLYRELKIKELPEIEKLANELYGKSWS